MPALRLLRDDRDSPPDPTTLGRLQHRLLDRNVQIDLDVSWSHESAATMVALDVSPDSMRP